MGRLITDWCADAQPPVSSFLCVCVWFERPRSNFGSWEGGLSGAVEIIWERQRNSTAA